MADVCIISSRSVIDSYKSFVVIITSYNTKILITPLFTLNHDLLFVKLSLTSSIFFLAVKGSEHTLSVIHLGEVSIPEATSWPGFDQIEDLVVNINQNFGLSVADPACNTRAHDLVMNTVNSTF